MPKYIVCYSIMGSGSVEVDAESPDAAIEAAYDEAHTSVCHQCARNIEDPEIHEITAVMDADGNDVTPKEAK